MLRQLLKHINDYLNGCSTLRGLQTWLLSNLQQILESGDEAAIRMANQMDADLIELGEGLIDAMAVRERLEAYVGSRGTIPIVVSETEHFTTKTTVGSETSRDDLEALGPVADLRLGHEFI